MPTGRGGLGYGLAVMLGVCAVGSGCSTLSGSGIPPGAFSVSRGASAPVATVRPGAFQRVATPAPVLEARSSFRWSVETPERHGSLSGTAIIGPDGTAELGPFGSFRVAGMTRNEAADAIQHQLASHLPHASVRLDAAGLDAADGLPSPDDPRLQQAQFQAPAQQAQTLTFATGVRSDWKPVERPGSRPSFATGTATPPRPFSAMNTATPPASGAFLAVDSGWQPARSGLLQRVTATSASQENGPQLTPFVAPQPSPLNGPPPTTLTGPPPLLSGSPVPGPGPAMVSGPIEMAHPPFGSLQAPLIRKPRLGPPLKHHNKVQPVPNVPNEQRRVSLPPYRVAPPDILQIDSLEGLLTQPIRGPHLIRPDGTIGLGAYGSVYIAGMTLDEVQVEIARVIQSRLDPSRKTLKDVLDGLSVDVLAYNSRVYYVITDRLGSGEIVERIPVTGNETVLDAISQIKGLPPESSKRHIWVARRSSGGGKDSILPVDWVGISQKGQMGTNYQLMPGDRLYVKAEHIQRVDTVIAKILSPIQRLFGAALLGAETVNTIRFGSSFAR